MRIALITREYPPDTSWGGISTHYEAFSKGLADVGCRVEIFTQGIESASIEKFNNITVHRVLPRQWLIGKRVGGDLAGGSLSTIGLFSLALAYEVYKAFSIAHKEEPFDIVEGHEHLGINSLINMKYSRTMPTITRYQTAYDSLVSRKLANWPRSYLVRLLELISLKKAGYRIATSKHVDNLARIDFPGLSSADRIIPNIAKLADNEIANCDSTDKELLILFVGRMMPGHKNPDMAAKAFCQIANQFPDWSIEFSGLDISIGNNKTAWTECQSILKNHEGRYKYHGVLNQEEVGNLYRKAKIIIMPSTIESYGLVALEAMAYGCVPIVSNNTALPEVVGDAGVIFENGSHEDLVTKLSLLLSDEKLNDRAEACKKRIKEKFNMKKMVLNNIEYFESILNN